MTLALAEIDPNICGFEVDQSTFKRMKLFFEKQAKILYYSYRINQSMIPEKIEHDLNGSKEFYEWYRDFDLESIKQSEWINWARTIYFKLPYSSANVLDRLLKKIGIRIF